MRNWNLRDRMMIQGTPKIASASAMRPASSGNICDAITKTTYPATTMSRPLRMASGCPWYSNDCPSRNVLP